MVKVCKQSTTILDRFLGYGNAHENALINTGTVYNFLLAGQMSLFFLSNSASSLSWANNWNRSWNIEFGTVIKVPKLMFQDVT